MRYKIGEMLLNFESQKGLVMMVVSFSGITEKDAATYLVDVADPTSKYESSTSLWFPTLRVQEDSFQIPVNDVRTFRLLAGGQESQPFTVSDEIADLVKAGSGLNKSK